MSVYRPKFKDGTYRTEWWHYDFVLTLPSGERRRFHGSTGQSSKAAARKVEHRTRELAADGKLGVALTLAQAATRFADECEHQPTIDDTEKSLEHLCRLIGPETPLIAVGSSQIGDAVRRRAAETVTRSNAKDARRYPISNATVNRQIVEMARRLLRRAKRVWKVPVDVDMDWGALKLPESRGRTRVLRTEERATLAAQTRADYAPIFRAYQITGARKAALCGLRKAAVDFDRDGFTIVLKRKRGEEPREHFVPFTDELRAIVREEMARSPLPVVFTFEVQHGPEKGMRRPITYAGLRRVFDNARAGLEDFRFHDQRHDAATAILRETGSLSVAGRLLGHADLSSTQRYAHVLDEDLRAGMRRVESSRNSTEAACGKSPQLDKNTKETKGL